MPSERWAFSKTVSASTPRNIELWCRAIAPRGARTVADLEVGAAGGDIEVRPVFSASESVARAGSWLGAIIIPLGDNRELAGIHITGRLPHDRGKARGHVGFFRGIILQVEQ